MCAFQAFPEAMCSTCDSNARDHISEQLCSLQCSLLVFSDHGIIMQMKALHSDTLCVLLPANDLHPISLTCGKH